MTYVCCCYISILQEYNWFVKVVIVGTHLVIVRHAKSYNKHSFGYSWHSKRYLWHSKGYSSGNIALILLA